MSLSSTLVALTGIAILTGSAAQAEQWTKNWSVNGKPELRVSTGDASVEVEQGSSNQVEAVVRTRGIAIGGSGIKITEHQDGNRVELEVREPAAHFSFGNHSVELKLRVPKDLTLDVHTGDGSIKLSSISGLLRVNTGDGSIEGEALDGALEARSGDGSLNVRGRFDKLQVRTSDGSVNLKAESGSRIASDWRVETGDGSVHMSVPHDLAANVQLHTGDGSIHLDLPLTTQGMKDEHEIQGKLNGGGPFLDVRTGDGSISLSPL